MKHGTQRRIIFECLNQNMKRNRICLHVVYKKVTSRLDIEYPHPMRLFPFPSQILRHYWWLYGGGGSAGGGSGDLGVVMGVVHVVVEVVQVMGVVMGAVLG